MTSEVRTPKKIVSLWLPIAVLFLGLIFFIFVFIEYQRNTSLVEQNRALITNSAEKQLSNNIVNNEISTNWGGMKANYDWIKHAPQTYWFNNGVQEFPWTRSASLISNTPNEQWESIWSEINSAPINNDVNQYLNKERLSLLGAVKAALVTNDESVIEQSFDAYLEHKNAYHLSPQQEVAFSLKLTEIGAEKHWSSEFIHAILITGGNSESPMVRPVIDILFRHSVFFTPNDFDWIINKVRQHLEAFNLSSYYLDDYLSHLDMPRFVLPLNINTVTGNINVVTNDNWFLHRVSEKLISANPTILSDELQLIENEFIALGALDNNDSLFLQNSESNILLDNIRVGANKAQLNRDQRNQLTYLIIKSIMLIAFIALILLTLRLIEKHQQRRFEYLALKEDFVKLVSHELKTPLAGIRAMAETLRKRVERNMSVELYPERIVNEADKLWYMVDNILGFNRVQLKDAAINKHPTKIKPICESIIQEVHSFSNKTYVVNNTVSESIEAVVDAELFSLVVKNIIVNAGLYNDHETVEIGLRFDDKESCLFISDNGIGIAETDQNEIFKPFVRLKQSVRHSGTGLGLAICKRIMQLHNGDLSLADSNIHGSIWKINLTK